MTRSLLVLIVLALFASAPLASAESTDYDVGPVHVDIDWNDTPHCALRLPRLPCLLGWDQNGTPTDPGDDTLYPYRSIDSLDVDVDQVGPVEGTSFHHDFHEDHVPHSLVDTLDGLLKPLVDGLPPPFDVVKYHQYQNSSGIEACFDDPVPGVIHYLCPGVPVGLPYTNRNGTRIPTGVNDAGSDTDTLAADLFDRLRLCWIGPLGEERSPLCGLLPYLEELHQLYRRLTPNVIPGAGVNETHFNLMDPNGPRKTLAAEGPHLDRSRGAAAPPSDAGRFQHVLPYRPAEPVMTLPASVNPATQAGGQAPPLHPASGAASLVPATPAPSWLLPAAAAAVALMPIAWALYQRITRERALKHETRRRILSLVEAHPGISVGDAAKQLDLGYHTAAHHVRTLRRCGKLETVQAGRNVALYVVGALPRNQLQAVAHLRRGPQAEVLQRLAQAPDGLGVTDLAGRLGCVKSSAHAKLHSLATQKLAEKLPGGRYRVTLEGERALAWLGRQR